MHRNGLIPVLTPRICDENTGDSTRMSRIARIRCTADVSGKGCREIFKGYFRIPLWLFRYTKRVIKVSVTEERYDMRQRDSASFAFTSTSSISKRVYILANKDLTIANEI